MKNVLLPTDFSDNAWNALFTAVKLYADLPCQFFLLHTYEPEIANMLGDKSKRRLGVIYDSLRKHSNQELDKILEYLEKNHKNGKHTFEKISKPDDLVSVIKEKIKEKDIDVVIMGTKGATGAKKVFMGSNTVKVIKAVRNKPVIAVPENHDLQRLEHIIFPTDFTRHYEAFELQTLLELSALWKSRISIFQVAQEFLMNDTQKSNKKLLTIRLKDIMHDFHKVEMKVDVAEAIGEFAQESDADMLALIHYRHTFLEKLTREPVVKKVAFQTQIPLLVLPELS